MKPVTLRSIILGLEEKLTLVPGNKLAKYAIQQLRKLEMRIEEMVREAEDFRRATAGEGATECDGRIDSCRMILGEEGLKCGKCGKVYSSNSDSAPEADEDLCWYCLVREKLAGIFEKDEVKRQEMLNMTDRQVDQGLERLVKAVRGE